MIRRLATICLLGAVLAAEAAVLEGRIISVADGDSVTLLDAENRKHRIRIGGIDAPQKGQAFGNRSKQNLDRIAHRKDTTAQCHKKDQYRRQVCKVWARPEGCAQCGKTLNVGIGQVIAGMAWWYPYYAKEQSEKIADDTKTRKPRRG